MMSMQPQMIAGDLTALGSARRERLLIDRTSIPPIIWVLLLAGGAISVAFSSVLGAASLRMHLAMSSLLALSGALVLLLIVSLGNPFRGDVRISAEPFARALAEMSPDIAAPPLLLHAGCADTAGRADTPVPHG